MIIISPWDWTTSNGTATAEETQSAYDALVNHDETLVFSYKVWNDLVNKIDAVNTYLFGEWDSTYLPLQDTLMGEPKSVLTASRFNSARTNTKYSYWSWADNPDSDGYIGRVDFKGASDYGLRKADIVYASYILEMVNTLNIVIGIINDTQSKSIIESSISSELATSALLEYELHHLHFESVVNHLLTLSVNLKSYYVAYMNSILASEQDIDAELLQLPYHGFEVIGAHVLESDSASESLPGVIISSANSIYLGAQGELQSNPSHLIVAKNNAIHLEPEGLLVRKRFKAIDKNYNIGFNLQTDSQLISARGLSNLYAPSIQGSITADASVILREPWFIQAHAYLSDSYEATLEYLTSIPFNCVSEDSISSTASLEITPLKHYYNANFSGSIRSNANMTWIQGAVLEATNSMQLTSYSYMSFPWEYPVITGEDAYITQVWSTEKTGKNLFIDS